MPASGRLFEVSINSCLLLRSCCSKAKLKQRDLK